MIIFYKFVYQIITCDSNSSSIDLILFAASESLKVVESITGLFLSWLFLLELVEEEEEVEDLVLEEVDPAVLTFGLIKGSLKRSYRVAAISSSCELI